MSANHIDVVLVHGAWADGSSWSKVIGRLKADGMDVVAAPLPLTSLADDVAALCRVLERLMISPDTHRFMAERMGARTRTLPVDHTPLVTAPDDVVDIILDAARDMATTG